MRPAVICIDRIFQEYIVSSNRADADTWRQVNCSIRRALSRSFRNTPFLTQLIGKHLNDIVSLTQFIYYIFAKMQDIVAPNLTTSERGVLICWNICIVTHDSISEILDYIVYVCSLWGSILCQLSIRYNSSLRWTRFRHRERLDLHGRTNQRKIITTLRCFKKML